MEGTITISIDEYKELITKSIEADYKAKIDELNKALETEKDRKVEYLLESMRYQKELEKMRGEQ